MRPAGSAFIPRAHAPGGARVNILSLEDYLMDQYYIRNIGSV